MINHRRRTAAKDRRGAVTVEMALIAPVFLAILLGVTEASRMYEIQNQLSSAIREGSRLAAMDREGYLDGQSTNQKVVNDVKNLLDAAGVPGSAADVTIKHHDSDIDFDLDDPANDLDLFTVTLSISMEDVNVLYGAADSDAYMSASITLRNARTAQVQ